MSTSEILARGCSHLSLCVCALESEEACWRFPATAEQGASGSFLNASQQS